MKKLFMMFCFVVGFLLIPTIVVVAAGVVGEQVFGVENIESYFVSLAALAAAVIPVTQFVKKLFKSEGGVTKFLSWIVAIGLAFVGWWLDLGILTDLKVLWVVIYGIAAGLISNSIIDLEFVQGILSALKRKTDE